MTRNETRIENERLIAEFLKRGGAIKRVAMAMPGRKGKSDEQKIAELEAEIQRLQSAA
jgi:hypothetical protein